MLNDSGDPITAFNTTVKVVNASSVSKNDTWGNMIWLLHVCATIAPASSPSTNSTWIDFFRATDLPVMCTRKAFRSKKKKSITNDINCHNSGTNWNS